MKIFYQDKMKVDKTELKQKTSTLHPRNDNYSKHETYHHKSQSNDFKGHK